jgi:hypothetical protein
VILCHRNPMATTWNRRRSTQVSIMYRNVMLYEIRRERPQPECILSKLEHGTTLHCTQTLRFELRLQPIARGLENQMTANSSLWCVLWLTRRWTLKCRVSLCADMMRSRLSWWTSGVLCEEQSYKWCALCGVSISRVGGCGRRYPPMVWWMHVDDG